MREFGLGEFGNDSGTLAEKLGADERQVLRALNLLLGLQLVRDEKEPDIRQAHPHRNYVLTDTGRAVNVANP
jgi:hypothetical protein